MKLKWAFSLVLVLVLAGCHEYPSFVYETIALELSNADNSEQSPVDDADSVPKVAYAIKITYTMHVTQTEGADTYESSFQHEDNISAFTISSPETFNLVPPNNSLNSFFNYSTGAGTGIPIIPDNYYHFSPGGTFFEDASKPDWTKNHYLMLMNPPDTSGLFTFVVDIEYSDGRELIDTVHVKLYE